MSSRSGTDERHRVRIGAAILAVLLGLGALIFWLDDVLAGFQRTYVVVGIFPKAPGLVAEAPVWVAGAPVGRVRSVNLLPIPLEVGALVAVEMKLPRRVRHHVRTDSYAEIRSPDLLGGSVVNIMPGSAGAAPLDDGDTIRTVDRTVQLEVGPRIEAAREEFAAIMDAIASVRTRAGSRMAALQQVRTEAAAAADEAGQLAREFNQGPAGRMLHDPEFRASLARVRTGVTDLRAGIDRLSAAEPAAGPALGAGVEGLVTRVVELRARLDTFQSAIEDGGGFIGRAAEDHALQEAVRAARAELDALLADVMSNPFRFFRFRF
jgi:ABC-type transporter Mla subunit MlaD